MPNYLWGGRLFTSHLIYIPSLYSRQPLTDLPHHEVARDGGQEALDDNHDEEGEEVPTTEESELVHHSEPESEGGEGGEGRPELGEDEVDRAGEVTGEDEVGDPSKESHHYDGVGTQTLKDGSNGAPNTPSALRVLLSLENDEPERVENDQRYRGHEKQVTFVQSFPDSL